MTIFYTSDQHIKQSNVAKRRGFGSVEEHDDHLAHQWDSVVGEDDVVFLLGDVSAKKGPSVLEWVAQRTGTKHLISGNHDPVHPMHNTAVVHMTDWLEVFDTIQPFALHSLDGIEFLLSHFPYEAWGDGPARPGSRYNQYRLPDHGMPLLHGHTHGKETGHSSMLHVGVDAWAGHLVSQHTVLEWLTTNDVQAGA